MNPKLELKLTVIAFLIFLGWAFLIALTAAIDAPTFHLDGAFQNASGLFRLSAGLWPGKDFFPYLGIGPLFIQFPFFYVFGGDLAASVISSNFIILLCGMFVFSTIIHFVFRPSRFRLSIFFGCINFLLFCELAHLTNSPLLQWFYFLETPGNSLRPLRSIAPYLVAIVFYLFIFKISKKSIYILSVSLMLGLTALWANDFAIPTIFIFSIFFYLVLVRLSKDYITVGLLIGAGSLVFGILALTFSTLGYVIPFLKFNFVDVAGDQWWYFAPYTENFRIFNWKDLSKIINNENFRPAVVLIILVIYRQFNKTIETALLLLIGLVLITGGALASIGGHLGGYFQAFDAWGVLLSLAYTIKLMFYGFAIFFKANQKKIIQWIFPITSAISLCFASYLLNISYENYENLKYKASLDEARFYVPELGAYLPAEWRNYIQVVRENAALPVIEEYWGIWSAVNKVFPPYPVDSVIHALGNTRDKAKSELVGDKLIITTRYSTSPMWQPWNISENFWFYERLFEGWQPVMTSPTTVLWKPGSHFNFGPMQKCRYDSDSKILVLPDAGAGFHKVALEYKLESSSRSLLLIKNNISFPFDANGFVSLNPKQVLAHFPVFITNAGATRLPVNIETNSDYSFLVSSCEFSSISPPDADVLVIPNMDYYQKCSIGGYCR